MANINDGSPGKKSGNDAVIVTQCDDFTVSGDGSSEQWDKTRWIDIPQRAQKPVTYKTMAKVLYSETGIYFLFDCQDKILNATIMEDNMNLWEEDVVEVFLWTEEDFPVYFEYEISALNYELPIIVPNYNGDFYGWLPWHYEGNRKTQHATSTRGGPKEPNAEIEAWMAEIFIPYELLSPLQNVPPEPGTKWRANMYRIDYDQGQTQFTWQIISKTFHDYKKFGTFIFE
ncbi:MAG: hypothetical protein AMS26_18555 [Bacteroides sp. SM23_62]|nr:MAG: hypothetical protein AMS26_18555 [Bacteroides sp. SM23_62]